MFEIIARRLGSGILKEGALGFAAKGQGFALSFGLEAESPVLQFCGFSLCAQIQRPRQ